MNYQPYAGYWFYGTDDLGERAGFITSWGLLSNPPEPGAPTTNVFKSVFRDALESVLFDTFEDPIRS